MTTCEVWHAHKTEGEASETSATCDRVACSRRTGTRTRPEKCEETKFSCHLRLPILRRRKTEPVKSVRIESIISNPNHRPNQIHACSSHGARVSFTIPTLPPRVHNNENESYTTRHSEPARR